MDLQIEDRVAIVTGASRGLGRAIAVGLGAEGARVLAVARSKDRLESLAAASDGRIAAAVCDMSDDAQVASLVELAMGRFGRLDAVVNNAGISPGKLLLDSTRSDWEHIFAVNFMGPVCLCRAAGSILTAQRSGKIVNVASITGLVGRRTISAYSAAKAALIRFSESIAHEWADSNVQVNVIAPGGFDTEAHREVLVTPDLVKARLARIPVGRLGRPDEIASLVAYLVSPRSDFMTGATLVVDGGEIAHL